MVIPNNSLNPPPINTPITTSGPDPVGTPFQNKRTNSDHPDFQGGLASGNVTMGWVQWFNSIWTFIAALFPFLSGTGMLGVIANAPIVTSGLGTSGQVLTSNGAAVAPSFQAASALSTFSAQRTSNPWFGTPATARALSTVYQNLVTPARPILVSVQMLLAVSTISDLEVGPTNPPTAIPSSFSNNSTVSSLGITHTAVVPPNYFYQVLGGALVFWTETA